VLGDVDLQRHDQPLADGAELAMLIGRYHSDELGVDARLELKVGRPRVRFGRSHGRS
jgi:hypothetical protein